METGSPSEDSNTSSKYDDDNEVSSDDEICFADDPDMKTNMETGSPSEDSNTSSKYDDDNEVSSDDKICFADDPDMKTNMGTGSPSEDSNTSREYDDDIEVSFGDDETCLANDPHIIQNFTGLNKIGEGGYGLVYEAESKHDGKKYALKFVKLETDLVYREVQVLQSLDHKNVLKYYKYWIATVNNSKETSNTAASEENSYQIEINNATEDDETNTASSTEGVYCTTKRKNTNNIKINKSNLKISEEDDTTNTASSSKENFDTNERQNLNLKISEEDDVTNTASSPEAVYNINERKNANSKITSNAKPKIPEEDDVTNTASSPEGIYNINERNNANSKSTSTSRRFTSSEKEHVSFYLVIQTELCQPRVNLEVLIKSKKVFNMNENQRCQLFLEIVHGLQHIHDKRIIHRDLKPANILIGIDDQEAKIADFGFARKYEMSNADGNSSTSKTYKDSLTSGLGTPGYTAPEVKESTVYSCKADLYSLGIILSEMYLEDVTRIIDRLLKSEDFFPDLKNIPHEVVKVIKSLLSKDPSNRMDLESVIKSMSPLEQHQRVEVEAGQTEVLPEMDDQGSSRDLPTVQLYAPLYSAPTEESQQEQSKPDQSHTEDLDQLFNIY